MIGGTPAGVPAEYQATVPHWRESYHRTRKQILDMYLASRETCARIQIADSTWIPSAGMSWHELAEHADRRARAILERAIRLHKEPALELRS